MFKTKAKQKDEFNLLTAEKIYWDNEFTQVNGIKADEKRYLAKIRRLLDDKENKYWEFKTRYRKLEEDHSKLSKLKDDYLLAFR